eukprot:TRINITY_DN5968_c0_g1_i1.p2 TRINITY_DN5968_c0_g1~~TRINITY_DN5968_c0_g1_i1.p2  ORF type:complete len:114 (-),score=44.23 TRINITY_DN5968_c0_g1_i1:168-458(-)
MGGKADEASAKKILSAAGISVDDEKLSALAKELAGKPINDVIAAGAEKLAAVPSGGGGAAAAPAASGGGGGAAAAKKEEPEEEDEEEEGGLGDLFG